MSNSREYAKFVRLFVGPLIPRKIKKQRGIGYAPPMPDGKPDRRLTRQHTDKADIRNVSNQVYLKNIITPLWANKQVIKNIYSTAKKLTEQTNIKHHVDHIIPVRHPLVCGLHVESNLRIISATENIEKSNDFQLNTPQGDLTC
jgi:hypothetical protein